MDWRSWRCLMNDTSSGMLHGREVLPTMKTGWAMRLLSLQRDTLFYLHFFSLMVQKGRYATVHAPLSSPVYCTVLHLMLTNCLNRSFPLLVRSQDLLRAHGCSCRAPVLRSTSYQQPVCSLGNTRGLDIERSRQNPAA